MPTTRKHSSFITTRPCCYLGSRSLMDFYGHLLSYCCYCFEHWWNCLTEFECSNLVCFGFESIDQLIFCSRLRLQKSASSMQMVGFASAHGTSPKPIAVKAFTADFKGAIAAIISLSSDQVSWIDSAIVIVNSGDTALTTIFDRNSESATGFQCRWIAAGTEVGLVNCCGILHWAFITAEAWKMAGLSVTAVATGGAMSLAIESTAIAVVGRIADFASSTGWTRIKAGLVLAVRWD